MDIEQIIKEAAELERQRQAEMQAMTDVIAAAEALETSRPPFWATEGQ